VRITAFIVGRNGKCMVLTFPRYETFALLSNAMKKFGNGK